MSKPTGEWGLIREHKSDFTTKMSVHQSSPVQSSPVIVDYQTISTCSHIGRLKRNFSSMPPSKHVAGSNSCPA